MERRLSTFPEVELSKLVIMDGLTDVWQLSGNELELFREMIKEFKRVGTLEKNLSRRGAERQRPGTRVLCFIVLHILSALI